MQWGFPWINFRRQHLAVCPSPAGCNQYFILGTDVVGVSAPPLHQWRRVGAAQPVTTVPDHPGRAQWGAPRLGGKAGRLVSGLPALYPPSDMCIQSEPAGSHLQARESNFEYCLWYQFCYVNPNTCSRTGGVSSAWAIPGAGRVLGAPGSHRAETQILLPLLAGMHNQRSESAPL